MWCIMSFRVCCVCNTVFMTLLEKTEWRYNAKWSLDEVLESPLWGDSRLSLKSKGLWSYMRSKPYGWDFSASRMSSECKDETKSIQRGLRELESCGYLERRKLGTGRVSYFLSDNPGVGVEPIVKRSTIALYGVLMDKPSVGMGNSRKDVVDTIMCAYGVHEVDRDSAIRAIGDRVFDSYKSIISWMNAEKDGIDEALCVGENVGF